MKTYSSKQILFFIIGIHAIYFMTACYVKGIYLVDSFGYLMQADNIQSLGTWYAEDWNGPLLIDYFSIRPPLYACFIIVLRGVWNNLFFVLFVQNILSILNVWMVYSFVQKHSGASKKMQGIFVMGLLFYPAQMMHANFVMTEIIFQTLLVFLFLSTYQFIKEPGWKSSLQIAVLLSVCILTKPVSLFLPFVILVCMSLVFIKRRVTIKYVLSFVLVGLVLHVVCWQNKHATGYYHYSSIKTINQLKYNARYTLVNAKGEAYADSVITTCMLQANTMEHYGERLKWMDTKAVEIISEYPVAFLKLYTKGIAAFFLDPGRFDVYHFFAIEEQGTLGLMYEIQTQGVKAIPGYLKQAPIFALVILCLNFCWNVFVLICFCYFISRKYVAFYIRVIVLLFVMYIAAATGPVGVSRYRVPVYPFLWIGVLFVFSGKQIQKKSVDPA